MSTQMITLIIAIVGSTGMWQLLTEIYKAKRSKRTPLEDGILAELHKDIYDITERALTNKEISMDDWDNLEELYRPYKALGGNGKGEARYLECRDLPKVEKYE
jgi:hypothetical protein